jgi:UDP-N-acetylmuramyl tripeptide synthase
VLAAWAESIGPFERDGAAELAARGVRVVSGGDGVDLLAGARTLLVSPGLPDELPLVRAARERGLEVVDEAELGWRLDQRPWVGVTGTNGKSTTVRLVAAVLRAAAHDPVLGGNTGAAPPLSELDPGGDVVVAELSSYQLERSEHLLPDLAILTGVAEDHLDRHGSLERYAAAKTRMLLRADAAAPLAAVRVDDPFGRAAAAELRARGAAVRTFGAAADADVRVEPLSWDLDGGRFAAGDQVLDTRLPGPHNAANVAGALAAADLLGVDRATAGRAIAATPPPVGRCLRADVEAPFGVLLDFGKNPAGYAAAVATARGAADRRVVAVISASPADDGAGLEAKGRAAAAADTVLVTTERWTDEGPLDPPEALVRGARDGTAEVEVLGVRREALARAVELCGPGDVLAVVGRSPVPRPQVDAGGFTERFDDVVELRAALGARAV